MRLTIFKSLASETLSRLLSSPRHRTSEEIPTPSANSGMATKSEASPGLPEGKPLSPEPELSKPAEGDGQEAKGEATIEYQGKPPFAIPQPMREEQVQNAVKFLSHPKVRGSPIIYRRSFLEKKGLTREEIDEAFRLVPDPPSNATNVEAAGKTQASQPKSSAGLQSQTPIQPPQSAAAPVAGVSMIPSSQQSRYQWTHAFLAVGVLAASGAGTAVLFKKRIVPRLKAWVRKVVTEESESEKGDESSSELVASAAEAAKAAAEAAGLVAKSNQELLVSKTEERRFFEALMEKLDQQVKEIKSMGNAIEKLKNTSENAHSQDKLIEPQPTTGNGPTYNSWRGSLLDQSNTSLSSMHSKQAKVNGTSDADYGTGRPSSAPATMEPINAPHPKSYMEIMEMVQRGERPPNIREINDMPPNPNQQPSKPLLAPKPKPWDVPQQSQQKLNYGLPSQAGAEGLSLEGPEDGLFSQPNGRSHDVAEPWWKKKTVTISEIEPEGGEQRQFSYGMGANERPSQRGWVPPQPPSVAMPEAADAIRRPKPSVQKQQSGDEQSLAHSEDGEDGAVRASEPVVDLKSSADVAMDQNQTEIQEEMAKGVEVM